MTNLKAYEALFAFLERFMRSPSVTTLDAGFLGELCLLEDGVSADPTHSSRWSEALRIVAPHDIDDPTPSEAYRAVNHFIADFYRQAPYPELGQLLEAMDENDQRTGTDLDPGSWWSAAVAAAEAGSVDVSFRLVSEEQPDGRSSPERDS